MASKVPSETLQAIRERVSIVEVVSGYVSLKKAGKNYLGLCPFHAEKTPSFTVNDERGLFHCFGCGAGGTVFTFLMRADGIGFLEAVEALAQRAGVAIPRRVEHDPAADRRSELIALNDTAQRFFREMLLAPIGGGARQYLERRGVAPAISERYGLGFCPAGSASLRRALGTKADVLAKAAELGLLGRRPDGSSYDRFWGRVTFPIRDGSGRLVGFGGRTLGDGRPKYLNSPESVLFHKGHVLYGLFEARQAIRSAERVVIVEGYLDALALVEAGIGYTVASLGTALGTVQLRLARRFAPEIVAFFDGDRAGQDAAARAFATCAEAGVWGLGAMLPEGVDPDTFVRTRGAPATLELLRQAEPLADFFFRRCDPGADAPLPTRARAVEKVGAVLGTIADPVQFGLLVKRAAQQLRVDESVFREQRAAPASGRATAEVSRPRDDFSSFPPEESTLIEAMVLDADVARLVAHRHILDSFRSPELAEAGRAVVAAWETTHRSESAVDALPRALAARVSAGLLGEGPLASADRLQLARECIERIERTARRTRLEAARTELLQAESHGDEADLRAHLRRAQDLLRRKEAGHA